MHAHFLHVAFWLFRLLRYGVQPEEEAEEEHGKPTVKVHITSITPVLQDFAHFFLMTLVFNIFYTLMLV